LNRRRPEKVGRSEAPIPLPAQPNTSMRKLTPFFSFPSLVHITAL